MANYNDVFGAFTVPPAEATYSRLTLNDSGTLAWPANFSGEVADQYLATNILEISVAAGLQLLLPPANEASVGQDLVIRNVGAESIDLFDADGGPVTTLVTGESKYIYITNNSTAAGTWSMFTYGAGTSGADAALLAGEGLQAAAGNIIQVAAVHRGLDSDYQIVEEDRGQLLNVEVGTITVTTPDATAVASGFYCFMRNSALGNASVVPFSGQSINGIGAWTLSPGDSLILMSTGTNWVTVGFGQNVNFTFTELVINAAAGDATLSSSDVSGRMIRITGTATTSIVLTLPSVDNIYFVNVESGMGAHTVTLKTSGVGGVVVLNANEKTALYSDGVNVTIAITTTVTSTLSLTDGGPTAPSLFFALDTDTGLYRKTNDTIGFTAGGAERMALSPTGLTLQTALPVAQGGTGATTAENALTNLGATTNTRTLTAGNGLTGGGNLTADRTLALGTPGTLSGSTANAVTATSHTHAISAATDALRGVVELATDAETQAGTDTARAVTPAGLAAALANKANSTGSYPGLSVGWAQYANQLRPPAGDGVMWPNDAFGGSGDTASIVLVNGGGEAQRMRFGLSDDPDDYFEFVAASVDGLKINGHTVLNAANWGNYAPSKTGAGASGTWGINISGNADTVDGWHRDDLRAWGNLTGKPAGADIPFSWHAPGGQPAYVWGGNTSGAAYVYDPAGFSVAYAINADKVDGYHASQLWRNDDAGGFLSDNGYQRLPFGLIIQWGTATAAEGVGALVTFPIAFPLACNNVVATYAQGGDKISLGTHSRSPTNFRLSGWGNTCHWIAIGH